MPSRLHLLLALLSLAMQAAADTTLYIAPNGNDAAPGTLDAPFATLLRARNEIRGLKRAGTPLGAVTVYVRGGTYEMPATLQLNALDSGTPEAPIVYRAYQQEKPVLTAAHRITGFLPYAGKILKTNVANQDMHGIYFRQLFYNDQRQQLARYPNYDPANPYKGGWAYADGKQVPMGAEVPGENRHTFQYKAIDGRGWLHPEDAEVMIFPRFNWVNNLIRIKSLDHDTRTIALVADCSYAIRPGDRYYVRNLLEELDAPGEWFLDKNTEILYFWPPDNSSDPAVYAPRVRTILELAKATAYVTFRGFVFEDFEGTGITLTETTHCLIAASIIRNGGDYNGSGVTVASGSDNGVAGNDIFQIGSNAIVLSGGDRKTLTPAGNYADNNYIHNTGVFYKEGVGVAVYGVGNRASHNLIHDTPRFAVKFSGNNLVIEYNHIRHVNLETSDTGVLYTGGRDWISSRGTVIRYNYIHDSIGFGQEDGKWISPYYSWGIYLDDNAGGVDVIGNIVARAYRGLIHLHNGRDNLIENNIFVDGKVQQAEFNGWTDTTGEWKDHFPTMMKGYESIKNEPAWKSMRNIGTSPEQAVLPGGLIMSGNIFRRNVVYSLDPAAKLFSGRYLPLDHNQWDDNVYWHGGRSWEIALGGKADDLDLAKWRRNGQDKHSVVADPLFIDAAKDDYRLRPGSPALKLGFQPIPVEKIGPYQDDLRVSWPIVDAPGERERMAGARLN